MNRKTRNLVKQLHHADPKKRYDAVMALGQTGNLEVLDDLDKVANLDEDERVRHLAGQAVEVFTTLRRRQIERDRAAILAGEDPSYDWPELAQEKILRERETTAHDQHEEWSYVESKKKQLERMTEEEREKYLAAQEAERRRRARRRPFRILLFLALIIVCVAGAFVAYDRLTRKEPVNRTHLDALQELKSWVQAEQGALIAYDTAFANDAIDCATATAVTVPEQPEWIVEDGTQPFEGMDATVTNLLEIQSYLEHSRTAVQTGCTEGVTTVNGADVANFDELKGELIRGQRVALSVASEIETMITEEQARLAATEEPTQEPGAATQEPGS